MPEKSLISLNERGKCVINPEKYPQWNNFIKMIPTSSLLLTDLEIANEIIEAIEKGVSLTVISEMFEQHQHPEYSKNIIKEIILYFSSKGPEFYEMCSQASIDDEQRSYIELRKIENKRLENNNSIHR